MSEYISRILDNDFMGNKYVQIIIPILFVGAILYWCGFFKYVYGIGKNAVGDLSSSIQTELSQIEQVDPLDVGFANPKPNSTQLMESRGGRRSWDKGKFGVCTDHTCPEVEPSQTKFDSEGDEFASPLRESGNGGVVYTATGDQLMIVNGADFKL